MKKLDIATLNTEKCQISATGLKLSDDLSMQEWLSVGRQITRFGQAVQFWIGDWANYGDKRGWYTDSKVYAQIAAITGYDHSTIKDFKYVSSNIQSSVRTDDVSFSHHKLVSPLDPRKQTYYLNQARNEKLSVNQFREKIRLQERAELGDTRDQQTVFDEPKKKFKIPEDLKQKIDDLYSDDGEDYPAKNKEIIEARDKLQLNVKSESNTQEALFEIIDSYLAGSDIDRAIEKAQNIIKYVKTHVVKLQRQKVSA